MGEYIRIGVTNGGEVLTKEMQKRMHGWIAGATGVKAEELAEEMKAWVPKYLQRRSGGLENSIGFFKKSSSRKSLIVWSVGPGDTKYNYLAKWFPSSPTFYKNGSKDRDYLHHAWDAYEAQHDLSAEVTEMIKAASEKVGK